MRTFIGIQGHSEGQKTIDLLRRFYFPSNDCVVVGYHDSLSPVSWPKEFHNAITLDLENLTPQSKEFHPLRICKLLLDIRDFKGRVILTEHDSIFLKPIPELPENEFGAFVAGFCPPQWGCGDGMFLHPPFTFTSNIIPDLALVAERLFSEGKIGNGTPDVFMAMVCAEAAIKVVDLPGVWSTNGLDMRCASKLITARDKVAAGAWHIHGIKRLDHLQFILGQTAQLPKDVIWE